MYLWADQAVQWLERAREALEGRSASRLALADTEYELAWAYLQLGRTFDARNAVQRAIGGYTAALGEASLPGALALNRLAVVAAAQQEFREAGRLNQQALQRVAAQPAVKPLQWVELKLNAAELQRDGLDNLDQAAQLAQEALALMAAQEGPTQGLGVLCHGLLGSIYAQMGNHKAPTALQHYQQALEIAELELGVDHPQII